MPRSIELQRWIEKQPSHSDSVYKVNELSQEVQTELLVEALRIDDIHNQYESNKKTGVDKGMREWLAIQSYLKRPECWGPVAMHLRGWVKDKNTPASNILELSALFGVMNKKEGRPMFANAVMFSRATTVLRFSGQGLCQFDWDVWHLLLDACNGQLGASCKVQSMELIRKLGWQKSGQNIALLKESAKRLRNAVVYIESESDKNKFSLGKFVSLNLLKTLDCFDGNELYFSFDERFAKLFSNNEYGLIDWEVRKKLKSNELAKLIQIVVMGQKANCQIHKVEKIQKYSRLTSEPKKFVQLLMKALNLMVRVGAINSYWVSKPPRGHLDERVFYVWKNEPPSQTELVPAAPGLYVSKDELGCKEPE